MLDVTNWADKNTWVCRAAGCGLVLPSRVKLVLHIRRSHALTALEYFREHKDSLTTDIQHTCQVAPSSLRLELQTIHRFSQKRPLLGPLLVEDTIKTLSTIINRH